MLEIHVYRKGEVQSISDADALKILAAAFKSGFCDVEWRERWVSVKYGNIPGEFDIEVQVADH